MTKDQLKVGDKIRYIGEDIYDAHKGDIVVVSEINETWVKSLKGEIPWFHILPKGIEEFEKVID